MLRLSNEVSMYYWEIFNNLLRIHNKLVRDIYGLHCLIHSGIVVYKVYRTMDYNLEQPNLDLKS